MTWTPWKSLGWVHVGGHVLGHIWHHDGPLTWHALLHVLTAPAWESPLSADAIRYWAMFVLAWIVLCGLRNLAPPSWRQARIYTKYD